MSNIIDETGFEVPVRLLSRVRHESVLFVAEDIEDAISTGESQMEFESGAPVGVTVNNDLVRVYDPINGWRQPTDKDVLTAAKLGFPVNPWNVRRSG
jgi:hypothetical protein